MAPLNVVIYPDGKLKSKSSPIENIDNKIVDLAASMIDTMYYASGVGLAGPQVGIFKNILVVDMGVQIENSPAIALLNPQITSVSEDEISGEEGCLSIPGIYAEIKRHKAIEVKYTDIYEKESVLELEGLLARIVQHEIDHFKGVLFWDYLGAVKRNILKRKFAKLKKSNINELKTKEKNY